MTSVTPADLTINPRNLMFGRGKAAERWWNGGDPIATAFFNGLSIVFPQGEAFFIESVRHYRESVPESQIPQIDAFIKQEAAHSREHTHFNRQVEESGYDVTEIEAELTENFAQMKQNPPIVNLMLTVCFEHLTAIFAHQCLASDRHFKGAKPEAVRLWRWHAIEEIEHKAVAYDTWLAATQHLSAYKRWKFRSLVMLNVTNQFVRARFRNMGRLFKQDGIDTPLIWLRTAYYLFGYPGILRRMLPAWLGFFRPSFHPWQHDDRALLRRTEAELGLAAKLKDAA
jgi:predicted metal-dependent hydrolase